jgi:crossover junction endodeoxyribonuclease RuvC
MKTIILGVDPGSRVTGFGAVSVEGEQILHLRHGIIATDDQQSFAQRLVTLSECLAEIIAQVGPHAVVLEKIFLGKNADSAFKLGHARGVLMAEAARAKVHVVEYAARKIKKGITGSGSATKEDVFHVVQNLLRIRGLQKIDASDALSIACYHASQLKQASYLQRAVEI